MLKKLSAFALLLIIIGIVGSIFTFKPIGKSQMVVDTQDFDGSLIENIDIHTDNARIEILPTNENVATMEYTGKESKQRQFSADIEGSTLVIKIKYKHKWFNFDFISFGDSLTISLPEKLYDSIKLSSHNGRITIEELRANDIQVKTNNGRIELDQVQSENVHLKTDNGKIILDQVEGELYGKSSNGSISLWTTDLDYPIELVTSNGKIEVETDKEPTNVTFEAKTSNGKISIFGDSTQNKVIGNGDHLIKLKTSNGSITVTK